MEFSLGHENASEEDKRYRYGQVEEREQRRRRRKEERKEKAFPVASRKTAVMVEGGQGQIREGEGHSGIRLFFFPFFVFLAVFYLWCLRLCLESIRIQQAMASGDFLTRVTAAEERVRRREEEEEEVIQVKWNVVVGCRIGQNTAA